MQIIIRNLFPRDIVMLRTAWARMKGVNAHEEDFEHIPEPHDFVEAKVNNMPTQETQ